MSNGNELKFLRCEVQRLEHSKIELLRSCSTEIERLRRIIRVLSTQKNKNSSKIEKSKIKNILKDKKINWHVKPTKFDYKPNLTPSVSVHKLHTKKKNHTNF